MSAKDQRNRNKYWCICIKIFVGCENCGLHPQSEEECKKFHFHHEDSTNKLNKISRLVLGGASAKILIAELEKCKVVCESCHINIHGGKTWDI